MFLAQVYLALNFPASTTVLMNLHSLETVRQLLPAFSPHSSPNLPLVDVNLSYMPQYSTSHNYTFTHCSSVSLGMTILPCLKEGMTVIWDNASFHKSPKIKDLI